MALLAVPVEGTKRGGTEATEALRPAISESATQAPEDVEGEVLGKRNLLDRLC